MIEQIRHMGVVVRNIDDAVAFYRDVLGLRVYWDQIEEWQGLGVAMGCERVRVRTIKLTPDSSEPKFAGVELLRFEEPLSRTSVASRTLQSVGCTHLAVQVSNLEEIRDRLRTKGQDFISEPQSSPDGKVRLAFCRAPEEMFLELVELVK